nr:9190_t:CDS:2 [Entrophospora candida]
MSEVYLEYVEEFSIEIADFCPISPTCKMPLPETMPKRNNGVINIQNNDEWCFGWSILGALHPVKVHPERNPHLLYGSEFKEINLLVILEEEIHNIEANPRSHYFISHFSGKIPILGICMGEQCIFEVFRGRVDYAGEIVHGKTSTIEHDSVGLFINMPKEISATRYHSLAAQPSTILDELMSTCWSDTKVLMGIRHCGAWDENPEFKVKSPLAKTKVKEDSVSSILEKIVLQRYNDVEAAKKQPGSSPYNLKRLLSLHIAPPLIDFPARLRQTLPKYPAIMAEVKRVSPSKGNIDLTVNAAEQALIYAKAGTSVISVLTEPKWFKGSLDDMRQAHDILSSIPNRPAVL